MKNVTQEIKDKSIIKWMGFLEDVKLKKVIYFRAKYWNGCLLCSVANRTYINTKPCIFMRCDRCNHCSLHKPAKVKSGVWLICDFSSISNPIASQAILAADRLQWIQAHEYGTIVLEAIKNTEIDQEAV